MKWMSYIVTFLAALHAGIIAPDLHAGAFTAAPTITQTGKTITIAGQTKGCFGITIAPRDENENLDTVVVTGSWFDKTEPNSALRYKERGSATLRLLQPFKKNSLFVVPCFFSTFNAYRLTAFRIIKDDVGNGVGLEQINASDVLIVTQVSDKDCKDFGKSYTPLYLKPAFSTAEKESAKKVLLAIGIVAGIALAVLVHKRYTRSDRDFLAGKILDNADALAKKNIISPDEQTHLAGSVKALWDAGDTFALKEILGELQKEGKKKPGNSAEKL